MTAEFAIPVADVDAAGKSFDFPVRASWIRGALEDCEATSAGKNGHLSVRVSRSGHDLVVRGHLNATLEVPCARCLAPTTFDVDQELSLLFVPAKELKKRERGGDGSEVELSTDDADTFPYEGETLVLDDVVRDELVLETPMIPLCSEDCPGIRPPGAEAEQAKASDEAEKVDPRLLPLLRLKEKPNLKE